MRTELRFLLYLPVLAVVSCSGAGIVGDGLPVQNEEAASQAFLDRIQRDTFDFFWETTPPDTGLAKDRYPAGDVSSVAATGFALTSYLVGVERAYVSRADAAARTLATLRFLWQAPQSPDPRNAAGYRGFFYHFLYPDTGLRAYGCELSTVDTALLMAGVLSAAAFFNRDDPAEESIRDLADQLYRRVDWVWAYSQRNWPLLSMGWTPEEGFLANDWEGYNEAMILYILALGSPSYPIGSEAWDSWTSSYIWDQTYGEAHVSFGPMFGHQYSHVWIDFREIQDVYMRTRGIDYFVNSVRATHANREFCMKNPNNWSGYGASVWGLTASDGPMNDAPEIDPNASPFRAYWARGMGSDWARDDGTIAPTAVGGSVPFAPELTISTLRYFKERFGDQIYGRYGFKGAFNLSFALGSGSSPGWFAGQYLGIDQGPILLMIENHRTGFVWDLMKKSPYVVHGLAAAGFTGGWLGHRTDVARSEDPSTSQ